MMCAMPRPRYTLRPVGQLRTLIALSVSAGDELEVTTEPDGPGTWVSTLVRRWRSSTNGVIISIRESEPHTLHRSAPHPEMSMTHAHAHALQRLDVLAEDDPVLRQMVMRGRITAPSIEEDPRLLDDPEDWGAVSPGWHDEL